MKYWPAIIIVMALFLSAPVYSEPSQSELSTSASSKLQLSTSQQQLQASDCHKDNTSECLQIAGALFDDEQFVESLGVYEKLCALDIAKGCVRFGWIHHNVLDSQLELIIQTYQKACSLKNMSGCSNLGLIYENNNELAKANALYRQACGENNDAGCNNLAVNFEYGIGVELNYKKSAELYMKSCDLDLVQACRNAGDVHYYKLEDYKAALKWYKKSCQFNIGRSCNDVGYQYSKGLGTKYNTSKALKFYQKACEFDDAYGCTNLGRNYMGYGDLEIKQDYAKGLVLLEQGCRLGYGFGCNSLGFSYASGYGVKPNNEKALQFYEYGCHQVSDYSGTACYNAGWHYEIGITVDRDVKRAKSYYEKGCQDDSSFACEGLAILANPLFIDEREATPTPKIAFLTQQKFNGNLGGSIGADEKCQAEADAPDSKVQGRVFKAWLSGGRNNDNADVNRVLLRSQSPYELVDGSLLAHDFADLMTPRPQKIRHNIDVFANGKSLSEYYIPVWTGINDSGHLNSDNCADWHSSSADDQGGMGNADDSAFWTQLSEKKCSKSLRLYCFEQ